MHLIVLLYLAFSLPALAAPAHVHGEAKLEIVLDGNVLAVHLDTPLDGLLGFEHAPRTSAEKQAVAKMAAALRQPEHVFALPAAAACKVQATELASPILDGRSDASGHLDLEAEYRWQCENMPGLREITTRLFTEFPRLKRIQVDFAGPAGQKSGRLTPANPRFSW